MRCMADLHPHIEGRERVAKGGLPHKADDRGGDIFVLGLGPGAAEIGVRVAERVQLQPQASSAPRA